MVIRQDKVFIKQFFGEFVTIPNFLGGSIGFEFGHKFHKIFTLASLLHLEFLAIFSLSLFLFLSMERLRRLCQNSDKTAAKCKLKLVYVVADMQNNGVCQIKYINPIQKILLVIPFCFWEW